MQLWDRGYWESDDPDRGFKKGDLKFILHGEKLHGSWVLVRMKGDRYGGKRTNWLLIKHRDEFVKEGDANDILDEDRSVASGRIDGSDRERQGKGAKAVHAGQGRQDQSRCGVAIEPRRGGGSAGAGKNIDQDVDSAVRASDEGARRPPSAKKVAAMPDFVAPQLCASVESPPNSDGWCHEIKFDGYRMQLRVEDGDAVLKTRKGWTGPKSSAPSPGRRNRCRMC